MIVDVIEFTTAPMSRRFFVTPAAIDFLESVQFTGKTLPFFEQEVKLGIAAGDGRRVIPDLFIDPMPFVFEMLPGFLRD